MTFDAAGRFAYISGQKPDYYDRDDADINMSSGESVSGRKQEIKVLNGSPSGLKNFEPVAPKGQVDTDEVYEEEDF